jgi:Bacterial membrane protein YfhO
VTKQAAQGSRRVAVALLVGAWLAFNFPVFAGRVPFPVDMAGYRPPNSLYRPSADLANPLESDAFDLYYPWRSYLGDRLREGDIPMWDPYRLAGTPSAANPQMAVWYPPNWLFAVLPFLAAWTSIAVLSSLGALLLAYWFFRVLDLHRYAAAAGAIVFGYCGFLVVWSMHPTFLASAMWLPLALGGIEVALRGRPRVGVPLAGLALALSVLGGHTQVALYVWLAVGLWTAVAVLASVVGVRRRGSGSGLRELGMGALKAVSAFVIGAALSSLQLLPSLELADRIIRASEPYDTVVANALEPRQVATLFIPDRFGNPVDDNYIGDVNYTETVAYAGVGTLLLMLVAIWRRRDRLTLGFGVIGAVGVLASFGTPFYRLLYEAVPGMAQTRVVGRTMFLTDVALAGLAALGLDSLIRRSNRARTPVLIAGALVIAGIVLALVLPAADLPSSYLAPRVVIGVLVVLLSAALAVLWVSHPNRIGGLAVALVAVLAVDLWLFGFRYHPFQRPATLSPTVPEVAYLQDLSAPRPRIAQQMAPTVPFNGGLIYDLYDVHGLDTFILTRMVDLLSVAQNQMDSAKFLNQIAPFSRQALQDPVIDLIGVERLVAPLGTSGARVTFANRFAVLDQPGALPPAFLATCWEMASPGDGLDRVRAMTREELMSVAIVEAGPESRTALGRSRADDCSTGGTVTVDRYEPEGIEVTAEVAEPSVLVLTDAWYPGWEARIDGREATVLTVDHALRGVVVSPGSHQVTLEYRPSWVPLGLALTLGAAIAAGGYVLRVDVLIRRRIRSSRR